MCCKGARLATVDTKNTFLISNIARYLILSFQLLGRLQLFLLTSSSLILYFLSVAPLKYGPTKDDKHSCSCWLHELGSKGSE